MKIDLFLIAFIALLAYFTLLTPILGYYEFQKLKKNYELGKANKIKFFNQTILWSWVPVLIIVIFVIITDSSWSNIGIKWIDISGSPFANWINYALIGLAVVYLVYTIYTIFSLRNNEEYRKKTAEGIDKSSMAFLPISMKEKKVWHFLAISAGTTEELIFRGYFFYSLAVVFPDLSILIILLITTLLFGIGHIYQGARVIQPAILGLFYGALYIVLGSVFPLIILHILQDLVATYLLKEE